MSAVTASLANPFVGPVPFAEHDAPRFFGREREARQLASLLISERMVLLYSPSGAGKTSLLQARLVPQFRQQNFQVLPVIRLGMRRSNEARVSENRYVDSMLCSLGITREQVGGTRDNSLLGWLRRVPLTEGCKAHLLVLDQFEEVLTLDRTDRDAKQEFFRQLGDALTADELAEAEEDRAPSGAVPLPRWALFSMREEHIAALEPYLPHLPHRLRTRFRLDLLDRRSAIAAIRRPAEEAGRQITEEAANKLFDELAKVRVLRPGEGMLELTGSVIEPVQLQIVCRRMWDQISEAHEVISTKLVDSTLAPPKGRGWSASGGNVDNLLASHYDEAIAAIARNPLLPVNERRMRYWIDQNLVTSQGLRSMLPLDYPATRGIATKILEALEQARIVRFEERNGATWCEVTHDRLLQPIRQSNDRWYARHLSPFQLAARAWNQAARPETLLLTGKAVDEAETTIDSEENLDSVERDFLMAIREHRDRRRRSRQEKRLAWYRWATAAVAIACALLAALLLYAFSESFANKRLLRTSWLAQLMAMAEDKAAEKNHDYALVLAWQAWQGAGDTHSDASFRNPAIRLLSASGGRLLQGHNGAINDLLIEREGRNVISISNDRTAVVWDLESAVEGQLLPGRADLESRRWIGHSKSILKIAQLEQENCVATAGVDGTVCLWDLAVPNARPRKLFAKSGSITSLRFLRDPGSAGRSWLCTGDSRGGLRFWRVPTNWQTGEFGQPVDAETAGRRITAVALERVEEGAFPERAKARWLAAGDTDGIFQIWDLNQLPNRSQDEKFLPSFSIPAHAAGITDVEPLYRQAGQPASECWFATADSEGNTRLWKLVEVEDANRAAARLQVDTYQAAIDGKSTRDGACSSSIYTSVDESGRLLAYAVNLTLSGHTNRIVDLAARGDLLVSGSDDGSAILWDLKVLLGQPELLTFCRPIYAELGGEVEYELPNRLRNVPFSELLKSGRAHESDASSSVTDIHISKDNSHLAIAAADNTVQLWKLRENSGTTRLEYVIHLGCSPHSVVFSDNSQHLLTGCDDGTLRVWALSELAWEQQHLPMVTSQNQQARKEKSFEGMPDRELRDLCLTVIRRRLNDDAINELLRQFETDPSLDRYTFDLQRGADPIASRFTK